MKLHKDIQKQVDRWAARLIEIESVCCEHIDVDFTTNPGEPGETELDAALAIDALLHGGEWLEDRENLDQFGIKMLMRQGA